MADLRAGSDAYFQVQIRNLRVVPPAQPSLLTPNGGVFLTLIDPLGAQVATLAPMTAVSTGVFDYIYQTLVSSPLGLWEYEIKAVHDDSTHLGRRGLAFNLVDA